MAPDIPELLIWALLVAVIVQGFSMALLVYLMFRRSKRRVELPPREPPENEHEEK